MPLSKSLIVLMIAIVLTGTCLHGQVPQGQVLGVVTDSTGGAVPGVTVTLRNELTGDVRTTVTTSTGDYAFPYLDSSRYTVSAQKAGFDTAVYSGISVEIAQKKRVNIQLKLGQVQTQVEVTVTAPRLDTDTAEIGTTVSRREMNDIPLNGREFSQLAALMPGVQAVGTTGAVGITAGASFATMLRVGSGHIWKANNYSYDGVDNTFTFITGAAINPSIDSIQEFRIDRSQFQAEFGRGSNQIQIISKSGTNEFHGAFWEFVRNGKLNGGEYYTHQRDQLKRNQFGANLGGPIKRDKAFFFFNWETQRLRSINRQIGSVLTPKMREGDLSEFPAAIRDPFTGQPFPANRIPAERINPVSKALLDAYMPPPNLPGISSNFLSSFPVIDDWSQYITRIDYNISQKDRIVGRFSGQPRNGLTPGLSAGSEPTTLDLSFYNTGAAWTRNWSPRTLSEVRFGYHHEKVLQNSVQRSRYASPNIEGVGNNVPIITIQPFNAQMIAWNFPSSWRMNSYDWIANLTYVRGNHTIKTGFETRSHGWYRPEGPGPEHVNESFTGTFSGNGVADYLLGYPISASTNNNFIRNGTTRRSSDAYVQDDWKLTSKLTLNLGLRYDLLSRRWENNDLLTTFLPNLGKVAVAGDRIQTQYADPRLLSANPDLFITAKEAGLPGRTLAFGNHHNFSPRAGFAWRPVSKTVIRGGYGMFYMINWESVEQNGYAGTPYGTGGGSVANTNPPTLMIQNPFALGPGAVPRPNASSYLPILKDSYMQQMNFGVQRELPWLTVLEINFQDQHSIRLDSAINVNQPPATASLQPLPLPFPRFQPTLLTVTDDGHSRYDALEVLLRKSSAHYTFQFSYVWAKNIGRLSPEDPYHPDLFIGPRDYVPTEAKINYVLDLPVGKGRRWMNHGGIANAILGGWTTSGFFILHRGGPPLTISTFQNPEHVPIPPTAFLGDLSGARPDRICSGEVSSQTISQWFDRSCFVAPAPGTFGNSGTGILFGPSTFFADLGVFKQFSVSERFTTQFRTEMFNAFNHPNLSNPVTSFDSPFLGRILTKSQVPRVIQLALRLTF